MEFFVSRTTFFGGIKISGRKKSTEALPITALPVPEKVIIPVIQHTGAPARLKIKTGDKVKKGQLIAESSDLVSSNIHASISGVVKEIREFPHPKVQKCLAVLIESDGDDADINKAERLIESEVQKLSPEEILKKVQDAGVVGLGGAAFPAHVKWRPIKDRKIDDFIVNGAECEPFITCDHRLMIEKAPEIILGLKLALKVTGAKRAFIAVEKNKRNAINIFKEILSREGIPNIKAAVLNTKYPQGAEKQLIKSVLKREVPAGKLPLEIGIIVNNTATLFAVYEAVYEGKALYEEIITVTGPAIKNPANLKVRIGTPLKDIIDFCGIKEFKRIKIIVGGPMMGYAQSTLDAPVIKGSSCILALGDREVISFEDNPCIKCAKCVDVCPAKLLPTKIAQFIKKDRIRELDKFNIEDCIECGCCAYVCPAGISLVELVKLGKIKKRELKNG